MASLYYLVFWSRRSTTTVVPAATANQARSRAGARRKADYGDLVSARQAMRQIAAIAPGFESTYQCGS